MFKNLAASTTTTNAMVNIKINIGTPLTNSIYVLDRVLEILFLEIRPIPNTKPRIIAIKNELKLHVHYCKKFGILKNKILKMKYGEICLMENIRFYKQEEKNDKNFCKRLFIAPISNSTDGQQF